MYFITNSDELEGKKIGFTHIAQFADRITIVTEDGGIFGVTHRIDEDEEIETYVYKKNQMEKYIFENRYLVEELKKRGIITKGEVDNYKKKEDEKLKKYLNEQKELEEKKKRELYEELKKEYESKEENYEA